MKIEGLAYLATPYAKYPDGLDAAFKEACILAGRLLREEGIFCYSPIAHSHPIALYCGFDPRDYSIWLPFNEKMLAVCNVLIVAHMPTWELSKGIAYEVEYYQAAKKPIFDLEQYGFNPEDYSFKITERNYGLVRSR
jgi:hypothetical protein